MNKEWKSCDSRPADCSYVRREEFRLRSNRAGSAPGSMSKIGISHQLTIRRGVTVTRVTIRRLGIVPKS
jgi:hypothetical protein